jgi:hypothetical protein
MVCKYCKAGFKGGPPRIREHFNRRSANIGAQGCTAEAAEIEDVASMGLIMMSSEIKG